MTCKTFRIIGVPVGGAVALCLILGVASARPAAASDERDAEYERVLTTDEDASGYIEFGEEEEFQLADSDYLDYEEEYADEEDVAVETAAENEYEAPPAPTASMTKAYRASQASRSYDDSAAAPVATPTLAPLDIDGRLDNNGVFATREELAALRDEMKKYSWSKGDLTVTPYGFVNLAVAGDTQRSVPGDFVLYTQSPEFDKSSGFTLDARTSRLGLKVEAPRIEALRADVRGGFEFDFQGAANGSKNKGGVQLRRAFVELVDAERERRILAGQDWEIISPLAPQMLNYLPAGYAGDLQYRRAQVRFEQGLTFSPDLHWLGQVAICDNVLADYVGTSGVSVASSSWPIIEARSAVALFGSARDGLPITFGVSGHIGSQNYKFSPIAGTYLTTSEDVGIKTWSVNADLDVPITKRVRFQTEAFMGSNLSTFIGGVNQGVDLYRRAGIEASGGWMGFHIDLTEKLVTNFGYGIDKPKSDDLVGTTTVSNGKTYVRTKNELFFTNFLYNWSKNLMTGVEFSYYNTGYRRADVSGEAPVFSEMASGKNFRTEVTARFSF
ncbi:MAG: hypothetical protein HUK22_08690 [Thermoguttaceae bacterium]|nr:hypothetical protein [Thermoguttaceae bacterium]